ncbi:DUF190 domain-containing protein [bacterium]|nr:DUF190 domain-containing protein [bacterium]
MKLEGEAVLLRIFLGDKDTYKGKPVYEQIVLNARKNNIAGVSVFHGVMGFGANSRVIHSAHVLALSEDLPVLIEIVDDEDKINKLLPCIDDCVQGGLVTMEKVKVIKYQHDKKYSTE